MGLLFVLLRFMLYLLTLAMFFYFMFTVIIFFMNARNLIINLRENNNDFFLAVFLEGT